MASPKLNDVGRIHVKSLDPRALRVGCMRGKIQEAEDTIHGNADGPTIIRLMEISEDPENDHCPIVTGIA